MNISQLTYSINNAKLKDLVSIKEFQTEEDIKLKLNVDNEYLTKGDGSRVRLFITEKEFLEKYNKLNLNIDNIYYNKNTSFTLENAIVYLDLNKYILLDITNYIIFQLDENNDVNQFIKILEEHYEKEDYSYLLLSIPNAFKLEMLERLINSKDIIDDNIYSTFMSYYTTTDFGFNSISKETINKLVNNKSEKLKQETINKLSQLPEKITIYRGQADKSTEYNKSYSWTTDPSVAVFFSLRLIEENGKIVTGVVEKKDIIEYFDDKEKEVLVLPENIKEIKVYDFYTMDEVAERTEDILDIFSTYKYMLNNYLHFEKDDSKHGKLHCLRVLLHSLTIGKLKNLSDGDLNLLALASIYHDIGRIDDDLDELHGVRGKEIFENGDFTNNDIVKFLIEYHCVDDNLAISFLNESDLDNKDKIKELLYILKDADALDRLRFGNYGLDFTYLRNKESISMILFAYMSLKYLRL